MVLTLLGLQESMKCRT